MRKFTFAFALTLIIFAVNAQKNENAEGEIIKFQKTSFLQKAPANGITSVKKSNRIDNRVPPMASAEEVIFFEDFESYTHLFPPSGGWLVINNNLLAQWQYSHWNIFSDYDWENTFVGWYPGIGSQSAGILYTSPGEGNHNDWLISPAISLSAGVTYQISFYMEMYGAEKLEKLALYIGSSQSVAAMGTTPLWSYETTNLALNKFTLIFTPITTGSYYLGFHAYSEEDGYYISLDNIQVSESLANDAAITAIVAPPTLGYNLSANEAVTATITNYGANNITSMNMELTIDGQTPIIENLPSINILSGESYNYTFAATANLSAAGEHTITVRAILTGDENSENDSQTISVNNVLCSDVTLPLAEDFQDNSWLCWTVISNNIVNGPDGLTFPMGLYYTDSSNTNLAFGFSSYSYATDYNQYLITPELPTSTNGLRISFDYFINSVSYSPELFRIGYSTTTNSVDAFTWEGENAVSNEGIINSLQFSATVPAGTKYIAINYYSNYKWMLFIDNIIIEEDETNDAAITSIIAPPVNGQNLSTAEAITATIANYGGNTITEMNMELTIDNQTPIVESLSGINIEAGATYDYTFDATADLSAAGNHTITVKAILAGDDNPSNDQMTVTVTNTICNALTAFPWTESFEGEMFPPECWSTLHIEGTAYNWAKNTNSDFVHSGNASAFHVYSSSGIFVKTALVTPQLEVPNNGGLILDFWSFIQYPGDYDYCGVWISTTVKDDPAAFTEVKALSGDEVASDWQKIEIPLIDYGGQTIYVAFVYGGEYAHSWYIDDVSVKQLLGNDAAITSIIAPVSGADLSATEMVTAIVKNNGINAITSMNMELIVDDGTPIIESLPSINILSGATYGYSFSATANLSGAGEHTISIRAILAGDENPENDKMTVTVKNTVCNIAQNLPFFENFDASLALPPCWTTIDANNDGFNWYIDQSWNLPGYPSYNAHSEQNFVTSQSSYNQSGDIWIGISPDNYLITPQIFIPANGATLKYWVGQTFDFTANEHYSVSVSTTGIGINDFTEIFAEDVSGTDWYQKEIPLSAYANQNIYIAFRHFGCYDVEMLKLDDVLVEANTDAMPNNSANRIIVYPNPVINTLIIDNAAGYGAKIYDVFGKNMFDVKIQNISHTIDISRFSAGVYFLELQSDTSKSIVKLIKK